MTPIRRQYLKIKQNYPNAILLFRLGDFYETFDSDAELISTELEIVLTSRSMGKDIRVPMAGIPAHALESYLARLIRKGHHVAICEQISTPAASKGLVDREVVRVVTPGTVCEPSLLDHKANNYLASVVIEGDKAGLSYVDITTMEFCATQLSIDDLHLELERVMPSELIVPGEQGPIALGNHNLLEVGARRMSHSSYQCTPLLSHLGVSTLESFGCLEIPLAARAASLIVEYLSANHMEVLKYLGYLRPYSADSFMMLDKQTRRNLEIFDGGRWGGNGLALLTTLDLTRTPMGGRLLRKWLGQPFLDLENLNTRQDVVAIFREDTLLRQTSIGFLSRIPDIERIFNRVKLGIVTPRELINLNGGISTTSNLFRCINESKPREVEWILSKVTSCSDVQSLIDAAVNPEPYGLVGEGGIIKVGYSQELDDIRNVSQDARTYIAGLERKERDRSGVRNLKIKYNKVFGYYIEISNAHLSQVPEDYIRRQTLVGGERFVTSELKEYEAKVLNARGLIMELEKKIYQEICTRISECGQGVAPMADAVAHLDVLSCFAEVASRYRYTRPTLNCGNTIEITGGRHPVVERVLQIGTFVPNDTQLSNEESYISIITGPNMAGKSTYIRQVATIVLLAQIGSYVPADTATIGLVDRIFTRVGLQDDLVTGQSTFMIEMVETASILNQATSRSLVILDEIGRGTSTYDGLSIARSVIEHIHDNSSLKCKTLFATHYHELTSLESELSGVKNYTVGISEEEGEVIFLHRIVPGAANKSYGIHVARLAGIPLPVIMRARDILKHLENNDMDPKSLARAGNLLESMDGIQASMFTVHSQIVDALRSIDVPNMTPVQALNVLSELHKMCEDYDL